MAILAKTQKRYEGKSEGGGGGVVVATTLLRPERGRGLKEEPKVWKNQITSSCGIATVTMWNKQHYLF